MLSASFLIDNNYTIRDYVARYVSFKTGKLPKELKKFADRIKDMSKVKILIPRVRTENKKLIRILPPFIVPYKHYSADDVAESCKAKKDVTTTASEKSLYSWRKWWNGMRDKIRTHLSSNKSKLAVFNEALSKMSDGWLGTVLALVADPNFF